MKYKCSSTPMGRWFAAGCWTGRVSCLLRAKWAASRPSRTNWPVAGWISPGLLATRFPHLQAARGSPPAAATSSCTLFLPGRRASRWGRFRVMTWRRWPAVFGRCFGPRPWQRMHVWERDAARPGEHGFEPGLTPAAAAAYDALLRTCPRPGVAAALADEWQQPARSGQAVLDCILLEPGQWWVGTHRVGSAASQWPGGLSTLVLPPEAISRAWLKMEEALQWAALPIPPQAHLGGNRQRPGRIVPGAVAARLPCAGHRSGGDGPADPGASAVYAPSPPQRGGSAARVSQGPLAGRRHERPARLHAGCGAIHSHPFGGAHSRDAADPQTAAMEIGRRNSGLPRPHSQLGVQCRSRRQLQHNRREFCVAALQRPFRK